LIVRGGVGTGKTILAALVVDDLQTQNMETLRAATAYIYCNSTTDIRQILSTIVKQLAQQRPFLPTDLREIYQSCRVSSRTPTLEELFTGLEIMSQAFDTVYLVVDALNECTQDTQSVRMVAEHEIVSYLQRAHGIETVNILITTQTGHNILHMFAGAAALEVAADEKDLRMFIEGQLSSLPVTFIANHDLRESIVTAVVRASHGRYVHKPCVLWDEFPWQLTNFKVLGGTSTVEHYQNQSQRQRNTNFPKRNYATPRRRSFSYI
jgi:hypothetical protein